MNKKSKRDQFISSIPSGRKFLDATARRLSKQKIIPNFIRQRIAGTSNTNPQIPDNRRKKITPELQAYIQGINKNEISKRQRREIRELAHYAYIFDIKYYKNQLPEEQSSKIINLGDCLAHYCIEGWLSGIDPSPLFETNNYFSKYPDIKASRINPVLHFFQFGIQEGRVPMDNIHFMRKIADVKKVTQVNTEDLTLDIKQKKIGVFLHIFYPELALTIADYLEKIPTKIDIHISTIPGSEERLAAIFNNLKNCQSVHVKSFLNIGRDVAPFIVGFGEEIAKYDFILKLHSKKVHTAMLLVAGLSTA